MQSDKQSKFEAGKVYENVFIEKRIEGGSPVTLILSALQPSGKIFRYTVPVTECESEGRVYEGFMLDNGHRYFSCTVLNDIEAVRKGREEFAEKLEEVKAGKLELDDYCTNFLQEMVDHYDLSLKTFEIFCGGA